MVGVPRLTGKQKIYNALLILACEPGKIEKRLEAAYRMSLISIDPQLDLPPQHVKDFTEIRNELHKAFQLLASQPFKTDPERRQWATDAATRIVALYDKIARTR
jgi:hypothetical protein